MKRVDVPLKRCASCGDLMPRKLYGSALKLEKPGQYEVSDAEYVLARL